MTGRTTLPQEDGAPEQIRFASVTPIDQPIVEARANSTVCSTFSFFPRVATRHGGF